MKFKKTMRERYPRKTKKVILKYVTRSGYYDGVNFKERFFVAHTGLLRQLCSMPDAVLNTIAAHLRKSEKRQPENMTKEEEIAYMIGDAGISESLIESVNRCISCEAFFECSLGALPANVDDKVCKYYSHE